MIAATFWIGLAIEIGCYVVLAAILQRLGWQPGPAAALCLAMAVSWRAGFVLATFRLARVAPRPAWMFAETGAFIAAVLLMMLAPFMSRTIRGAADRTPVLLVHGWNCNSGVWWPLRRILRDRRVGDVHTMNLPPWRGLETHVEAVRSKVDEVLAGSPHDRIALVGHSMGGVISRMYLASDGGHDRVARLITLGSPHHGTALSNSAFDPAGRELGPGNPRLAALPPVNTAVPVTALFSEIDNFVAPQSSALLEGAENLSCGEVGHLQLLFSKPVLDAVALRLEHTR